MTHDDLEIEVAGIEFRLARVEKLLGVDRQDEVRDVIRRIESGELGSVIAKPHLKLLKQAVGL